MRCRSGPIWNPLNYRLFLLYEEVMNTSFSGRPVLRRVNVVFASEPLIEANRGNR